MSLETFYKDHWREIEPERMAGYEEIFKWSPAMAPLLEPAGFGPGQRILDFGCGPGYTTVELARRTGPAGEVIGVDLNRDMVASANARLRQEAVDGWAEVRQVETPALPFGDGGFDRVLAKNVLEYLDDPAAALAEFHRLLKPGGKLHVTDSDWGLFLIEPLSLEETRKLVDAARHAYKTPLIGRKLHGLCRGAGYGDVQVKILARPDLAGRLAVVAKNLAGYAVTCGTMTETDADSLLAVIDQGLADGSYFALNPQFLVTATK